MKPTAPEIDETVISGHGEGSFGSWNPMMFFSNRRFLTVSLVVALASLSTTAFAQSKPSAGAHSRCETAITLEAPSHMEGISKEYSWLKSNHPNARIEEQALIECKGKPTDSFTLRDANGTSFVVMFDLSNYWGKGL